MKPSTGRAARDQTINLTLLVEPFNTVHATTGRVPRKEIGMRRAWVNTGLATIAPTFHFGPVLVDPKQIRMSLATGSTALGCETIAPTQLHGRRIP
jgi:hypothetical protein